MAITTRPTEIFVTSDGKEFRTLQQAEFWECEGRISHLLHDAGLRTDMGYTGADVATLLIGQSLAWRKQLAELLVSSTAP